MAAALNADLASSGLTAKVTATASDAPASSSGRRLLAGGYGGGPEAVTFTSSGGCVIVYNLVIPIPAGQSPSAVASLAQASATNTAQDSAVVVALLKVWRSALRRLACCPSW